MIGYWSHVVVSLAWLLMSCWAAVLLVPPACVPFLTVNPLVAFPFQMHDAKIATPAWPRLDCLMCCAPSLCVQMPKELHDVKIAILTCPFEPPKPKTKHKARRGSRLHA